MYYVIDGWEMVAVVDNGDVESLFLFRVDESPAPGNINAIWAQRGIAGDWWADAWPGSTRGEAVMWAVENLGLMAPQISIDAWPMDWAQDETFGVLAAPDPVPYGDGMALSSPFAPMISSVDEPMLMLQVLEVLGEPAAASLATAGGTPGGGIEPAPDPEPGPGPGDCEQVRTSEQVWQAVAEGIEAELIAEGAGADAFDNSIGLSGACCWPRTFKSRPGAWSAWTCGGWSASSSGYFSGTCGKSITWKTVCTRSRDRLCWRWGVLCGLTLTTQTQTETKCECTTELYDTLNPGCADTQLPNPPYVAPPPFTGSPSGCGQPTTVSGWSPGC